MTRKSKTYESILNVYAKFGFSRLAVVTSLVTRLTEYTIINAIENGISILTNNSKYNNTLFVNRLVFE
ncbi:MAG: hypothetical protein PUC88_02930 [Clostridia bacterium]|nr:hypothetical protein [Clostridia bacterium]